MHPLVGSSRGLALSRLRCWRFRRSEANAKDAASVPMYSTEERDHDASTMTTAVGAELEGPSVGSDDGSD